jgi:hypothetical protein
VDMSSAKIIRPQVHTCQRLEPSSAIADSSAWTREYACTVSTTTAVAHQAIIDCCAGLPVAYKQTPMLALSDIIPSDAPHALVGELKLAKHVQLFVLGPVEVHVELPPQPPLLVRQLLIAVQLVPFA